MTQPLNMDKANKGYYVKDSGGAGQPSTGIWHLNVRHPIPYKLVSRHNTPNGEVKIIKPADPEKIKAYRASSDGQKRKTKQFGRNLYGGN